MLACFSTMNISPLGKMESMISQLEYGSKITKLNWNSKYRLEDKRLMLIRETRQLVWSAASLDTRTEYEGSLDLREVKEIRRGKLSKEFKHYSEETKKFDSGKCFVILYGNGFNLSMFSAICLSEQECDNWVNGLGYMVYITIKASYPLQVEQWLRKEYYAIQNLNQHSKGGTTISLRDFKTFLKSVSCKVTTSKLVDFFSEDELKPKETYLRFDDFSRLYQKLLLPQCIVEEVVHKEIFSNPTEIVNFDQFKEFLLKNQNDPMGIDDKEVAHFIQNFLQDVEREVPKPHLSVAEFVDFLFSKHNEIWDRRCNNIYMDMKQPIANYWIASSHNTYLTGDQLTSESSTEAYVRALRMGCRCIELDCWNGPDNLPYIYHGHTMTTRIRFMDVITTIKEHAFDTSEYPVILSIEQNCSINQQRNMAQALLEVFGDMLLTQKIDKNETHLPSPHQLRKKIILKHKTLQEGEENNVTLQSSGSSSTLNRSSCGGDENENFRNNILKEGRMHFKDPIEKTWSVYHFILTQQELIYSSDSEENGVDSPVEEELFSSAGNGVASNASVINQRSKISKVKDTLMNDELHFGENWFHGKLEGELSFLVISESWKLISFTHGSNI